MRQNRTLKQRILIEMETFCKGKQVHSIEEYIIMINMHAINNITSIYIS